MAESVVYPLLDARIASERWPIRVDPVFGCWWWTGRMNDRGYPVVWEGRRPVSAYKLVYEALVGPVPPQRVLDHWCRRRPCVCPLHLEPVKQDENERRKSFRYRCRIQRCPRGHSMALAMVTPEGGRLCRTCANQTR